tara:strand:+ start:2293 stop:2766 length:474 start_codon:yes stop_codon:yes gene_type:complete
MRTTRIRQRLKKYLIDNPEQNTTQIFDHINNNMKWGVTMQQLGNVLAKDKDIEQVGVIRKKGALSGSYEMFTWNVTPDYRKNSFGITKENLEAAIINWLEEAGPGEYVAKDIRKGLGGHHAFSSNVFKRVVDNGPEWLTVKRVHSNKPLVYVVAPRS